MSIYVAQTVQKRTVRDATVRHDGDLVSAACHSAPLAAQPPATYAWKGPRATRWWVCWSAGTEWLLACRGKVPCRGRCLVASGSLPLAGSCRDAWRVVASSLRCLGWPSRQAPLAGALCLEWPSRQAPLAGALSPWLEYFVLEWLQRNHGGPWRSPGKPCRGALRLPVHKFGILGYPYSSTPTGAPGPGPYTVPSAVGPGPKQGTGTRGLDHAVSYSASTVPSPNGTRRLRRHGRDRGWFFIRKGGPSAPSLLISRENRGSSPICPL